MKTIRSIKAAAFSLILGVGLAVSAIPASAQSVSNEEMKQVKNSLEQYDEFLEESNAYGEITNVNTSLDVSNSVHNVYKSYIIDNYIVDTYNKNADFDSVISDEYRIFAESGNQLVTMINRNGKLVVVNGKVLNDNKKCINFEDEAKKIMDKSEEKITDLKFAKSYPLYLDLIYYRTADNEFVVPYFDCVYDSVSKVFENGKSYTADEFVGRLNCLIDTSNCSKPGEYGGGPFRTEPLSYSVDNLASENSSIFYVITFISSLAVLASAIYVSVKVIRRKMNS